MPDFLVIGAMKAGTTSLHDLLGRHPDIFMSTEKELRYFVVEANWSRGESWNRAQFRTDRPLCGESSPAYTKFPEFHGVAGRIARHLPDARLVYALREPVSRLISHYVHRVSNGNEVRPIDDALLDAFYLDRSRYGLQLEQYLDAGFGPEAIHLLEAEDLRRDRVGELERLFAFLGVDRKPAGSIRLADRHRSRDKKVLTPTGRRLAPTVNALTSPLPRSAGWHLGRLALAPFSRDVPSVAPRPATIEAAREALAPDIARLRRITGRSFASWSV